MSFYYKKQEEQKVRHPTTRVTHLRRRTSPGYG